MRDMERLQDPGFSNSFLWRYLQTYGREALEDLLVLDWYFTGLTPLPEGDILGT